MAQDDKKPRAIQTIDANLKRVYEETLQEKVPDRFAELLRELRAQDAGGDRQDAGGARQDAGGDKNGKEGGCK